MSEIRDRARRAGRDAAGRGRDSLGDWWNWARDNKADAAWSTLCIFGAGVVLGWALL